MPGRQKAGQWLGHWLTLPPAEALGSSGVLPDRREALPVEALRDLLGIVRGLYAAGLQSKGHPIELETLRWIGKEIGAALTLASTTEPDTIGHRAAWDRAERAVAKLGELIAENMPIRPVLDAAVARALTPAKGPKPGTPTRDERRDARRRRG